MSDVSLQGGERPNELQLRRADLKERWGLASLALPGTLLLFVAVVMPVAVMTYLAFIGEDGGFSLEHFERLWTAPVYYLVFRMTLLVSLYTTLLVALIGYPLTYFIVQLPPRAQNIALLCVIIPLWTAVLVRTYAWLVLLRSKGVINTKLMDLGLISEPLDIAFNLTAVLIGMVHIMLPFLVMPLYASMKAIDTDLMAAASNLGASPARAFRDIYFPLSLPGFLAGCLMVFVLCLGFFVTPAVLGGGTVIMVAMRIEAMVNFFSNWGAASALGVTLLVTTMLIVIVAAVISRRAAQGALR